MIYKITHIRLSDQFASSTKQITHVMLESGAIEPAAVVAYFMSLGCAYYYINQENTERFLTYIFPDVGIPYIQTLGGLDKIDELLLLPLF